MNHYLYAIVERLPPAWRPPAAGVGGAPVVARGIGDVVVVTSALDAVPPQNPRTLAVHHDVVATTIDARAALPFHYGTVLPAGQLEPWLAGQGGLVQAALAGVRGCVEMSVKLLRLDCAVAHQVAHAGRGPAPRSGPGERELRALGEHLVDRAGLEHWRYTPSGSVGNVVASVAFLVPRPEVPAFLARIAPVASRAVGVAVVPTGPWPAYSFVPAFERLPLAHAGPPPLSPLDVLSSARRAG